MGSMNGLAAIVTGGGSGIGAATVAALRSAGADVAVLDKQISPGDEHAFECDVTDAAAVDRTIAAVAATFGRVDIVVNNAGIGAAGDITGNTEDEWRRVFDVNVLGVVRVTRAALPHLRESPHAAIVNTCSVVATIGLPQRALYSASKGAVAALTLAMAADHVGDGIRVNAVLPGTADTPWVSRLLDAAEDPGAAAEALRRRQPMGRLVTAAEVAAAILYLASPVAGSTTGTLLPVDGGIGGIRVPQAT
jgi:NAD(P)-dependent dehydrogenase (short-subunit alcohol dehydrogenase family)